MRVNLLKRINKVTLFSDDDDKKNSAYAKIEQKTVVLVLQLSFEWHFIGVGLFPLRYPTRCVWGI